MLGIIVTIFFLPIDGICRNLLPYFDYDTNKFNFFLTSNNLLSVGIVRIALAEHRPTPIQTQRYTNRHIETAHRHRGTDCELLLTGIRTSGKSR